MKLKQQNEIASLESFIPANWDGINMGGSGKFDGGAKFVEGSEKRFHPERTYFQINGGGKKGFETGDINELTRLNKLLMAKRRYDLQMSMWIEDIKQGLLFIEEIEDEFPREANIIRNKLGNNPFVHTIAYGLINEIEKNKQYKK